MGQGKGLNMVGRMMTSYLQILYKMVTLRLFFSVGISGMLGKSKMAE